MILRLLTLEEVVEVKEFIKTSEQEVYYGELDSARNQYNGIGLKLYPNGDTYYGNWHNGEYEGFGLGAYPNGNLQICNWHNSKPADDGIVINIEGKPFLVFWGELNRGKPKKGTGLHRDGKVFTGEWTEWRGESFDGIGSFSWKDGRVYSGLWKNSRQDIGGVIIKPDGSINGNSEKYVTRKDTLIFDGDPNRIMFYGKYKEETVRNGRGVMYYRDKSVFSGTIKHGSRNGVGFYQYPDGSIYIGEWKNNIENGNGIKYIPGLIPELYVGRFNNGNYDGDGCIFSLQLSGAVVKSCGEWTNGIQKKDWKLDLSPSVPENDTEAIKEEKIKNNAFYDQSHDTYDAINDTVVPKIEHSVQTNVNIDISNQSDDVNKTNEAASDQQQNLNNNYAFHDTEQIDNKPKKAKKNKEEIRKTLSKLKVFVGVAILALLLLKGLIANFKAPLITIDESVKESSSDSTTGNETDISNSDATTNVSDTTVESSDNNYSTDTNDSLYNYDSFKYSGQFLTYDDSDYYSRVGIDVSKYQGDIDWTQVASEGIEFAYIRLGYRGYGSGGKISMDALFEENIQNAQAAGLDVGVYFFSQAINETEAIEEADFVLDVLKSEHIRSYYVKLPIAYEAMTKMGDEGRSSNLTSEQLAKNAEAFCERIIQAGYEPILEFSDSQWEEYKSAMKSLEKYKFWYSNYDLKSEPPFLCEFLQYSNNGKISGINTAVDLDIQIIKK